MAGRELSPKTTNNALGVFSRAVRYYFESRDLEVPYFNACRVKVPTDPPKFWEPADYERIVTAAAIQGPQTLAMVLLMGDCGMRAGEVMGLEWTHVRWVSPPQLVIQRAFTAGAFGPTKNGKPRTVPMTARTAAALRALPRHLRCPSVIVRETRRGPTHMTQPTVSWAIGRVEQAAGLNDAPKARGQQHKLRHTYVTRLAAARVPARVIMDLAGHRHITTTLRYMHVLPGATAEAVAALETFDREQGDAPSTGGAGKEHHRSTGGS